MDDGGDKWAQTWDEKKRGANEEGKIKPEDLDEIRLSRQQNPTTIAVRIHEAYQTGVEKTQLELQACIFCGNYTQTSTI